MIQASVPRRYVVATVQAIIIGERRDAATRGDIRRVERVALRDEVTPAAERRDEYR